MWLFQEKKNYYGIASLDISTGEFQITEVDGFEELENELSRLCAKECVVSDSLLNEWNENKTGPLSSIPIVWSSIEDWNFVLETAADFLKNRFGVASLDGFGCRDWSWPCVLPAVFCIMLQRT